MIQHESVSDRWIAGGRLGEVALAGTPVETRKLSDIPIHDPYILPAVTKDIEVARNTRR